MKIRVSIPFRDFNPCTIFRSLKNNMHPIRKHIRLRGYDYSSEGLYFITICTKSRKYFFGNIKNQKFEYSPVGAIAYTYWNEIPKHFPNIILGEFAIMPNHIHGIVEIGPIDRPSHGEESESSVGTRHGLSPQDSQNKSFEDSDKKSSKNLNEFGKTIPGSVSAIIGQFKSSVTRWCNKNGFAFEWQSRFHDHIIRDEPEFFRIENYIINNVKNWNDDKFLK